MSRKKTTITTERAISALLVVCRAGEVEVDEVFGKVQQKAEAKAREAEKCFASEKSTISMAGELYEQEVAAATKKRDDAFDEAKKIGDQGDVLKKDSEELSAALAIFTKK